MLVCPYSTGIFIQDLFCVQDENIYKHLIGEWASSVILLIERTVVAA